MEGLLAKGADPNSAEVKEAASNLESAEKWGPGGAYRQIAQAISLAVSGNVGGSNIELMQGFAANYLQSLGAEKVKELAKYVGGEGAPAHIALHTLLGCAAGSIKGTCEQTAVGSAASVVVNQLLKEDKELSAEEKEKKINLTTALIGSVAAALGEQNVAAVTSGAQVESENNSLKAIGWAVNGLRVGLAVYTANEIASDILSVSEGNKTLEELAKEYGEAAVVDLILDKTTKGAVKQIKKTQIGKELDEKLDNFYEKGREWLEKKGYTPEKIRFREQQIADANELSKGNISVKELVDRHGEGYLEGLKDSLIKKNNYLKKFGDGSYSIIHTDPKTGKVREIEQKISDKKPQHVENKEIDLKNSPESGKLKEPVSEVSPTGKLDSSVDKQKASEYLGVDKDKVIENWGGVDNFQKIDQFLKEQPELLPILDKWGVSSLEKKGGSNQMLEHIFGPSYKNRILSMEKSFKLPEGHISDIYKLNDPITFKKGIVNFDKFIDDTKKFTINSKVSPVDSNKKLSLIQSPEGEKLYIKVEYSDKLQSFYSIKNIEVWEKTQ